jgi:hypothetical protein
MKERRYDTTALEKDVFEHQIEKRSMELKKNSLLDGLEL